MRISDAKLVRTRSKRARRRIVIAVVIVCALLVLAFAWRPGVTYLRRRQIDARVNRFLPLIQQYSGENELPPELVWAVVRAESSGDPRALSSKAARGLMQITDAAEQDVLRLRKWPKGDLFDPDYNIKIGTAYLRVLAERFDRDYDLAVAAYHMGARRVRELRQAHPELSSRELLEAHANPTTRRYCRTVRGW